MTSLVKYANFKRLRLLIALLLIGGLVLASALALGGVQSIADDYGISVGAGLSQHEECEPGEVWVPSATNPIAGECVAQ